MRLQTNAVPLRSAGFGPPSRAPRKRLKAHQARALIRLREIGALNLWRSANGILLLDYRTFVRVIIDALAHVGDASRRCVCVADVRAALPRDVAEAIADAEILEFISTVPLGRNMLSASDAGRLTELVEIERADIEAGGLVIQTLHPRDEDAATRRARREARKRKMTRERVAKHRQKRQENCAANCVTNRSVTFENKVSRDVTLLITKEAIRADRGDDTFARDSLPSRIVAAFSAGDTVFSIQHIADATDSNAAAAKVALGRLVKRGLVVRVGRGLYRARAP